MQLFSFPRYRNLGTYRGVHREEELRILVFLVVGCKRNFVKQHKQQSSGCTRSCQQERLTRSLTVLSAQRCCQISLSCRPVLTFSLTATPKIPFLTQSSRIVMNIHSRGRSAFRPNVQILLLLLLLPQASHPKLLFCYSPPSPFFASSVIRRIPSLPGFCIFGTNKTSDSHPFFVFLTFSCIYFQLSTTAQQVTLQGS